MTKRRVLKQRGVKILPTANKIEKSEENWNALNDALSQLDGSLTSQHVNFSYTMEASLMDSLFITLHSVEIEMPGAELQPKHRNNTTSTFHYKSMFTLLKITKNG